MNFRVEGREFGACVVDFALPIDPTLLLVTRRGPRGGFRRQVLGVAKSAIAQTLTRQGTQCVFRDIEPTPVLGRVPTFELPGPHRVNRFVKRAHRVRVEVVADHEHCVCLHVTRLQQGLHLSRPIDLGALLAHADMAPSLQWLGTHEHAGRACAFVCVVYTPGMVRRGSDGHTGFLQSLHRLFVHAQHGKPWVIGLRVRLEDVFHARDTCAVGGRRDDPVLLGGG